MSNVTELDKFIKLEKILKSMETYQQYWNCIRWLDEQRSKLNTVYRSHLTSIENDIILKKLKD